MGNAHQSQVLQVQSEWSQGQSMHRNAVNKLSRESGLSKPLVISSIDCNKDDPIINARVCQEAILPIYFSKITAMALLDTGADVNCIRHDFVQKLGIEKEMRQSHPITYSCLQATMTSLRSGK